MQKVFLDKSIWFFDVDDTLISFSKNSRSSSYVISDYLSGIVGNNKALQIKEYFDHIYEVIHMDRMRYENDGFSDFNEEYRLIIKKMEDRQRNVIAEYKTFKIWSREVFIKLAAEEAGIDLEPKVIMEAADKFWNLLNKNTFPVLSALEFVKFLNENNRPIFLLTGSDARLNIDDKGEFEYDPENSRDYKLNRLKVLDDAGFKYNRIITGDPIDKSDEKFFIDAVETIKKDLNLNELDFNNCVAVGDKYKTDLKTLIDKFNFGLAVLFDPDIKMTITKKDYIEVNDQNEIRKFLV